MSDNLCPDCEAAPGDDRGAGLCWDCFMKRELDEWSHGDTDDPSQDQSVRTACAGRSLNAAQHCANPQLGWCSLSGKEVRMTSVRDDTFIRPLLGKKVQLRLVRVAWGSEIKGPVQSLLVVSQQEVSTIMLLTLQLLMSKMISMTVIRFTLIIQVQESMIQAN